MKKDVFDILLPLIESHSHHAYMRNLFDPVQTHAVYGCSKESIDSLKMKLKKIGANKFRLVKNGHNPILCFNAEKIKI